MTSSRDREPGHAAFLAEAVRIAAESARSGGGPFGAVIVRGGEVIARGTNRVTLAGDPTAHAEIEAIRAACRSLASHQLDGCIVYSSSEPCPMCLGALYWARPERVYFASDRRVAAAAGFDDQFIYDELARHPTSRHLEVERMSIPDAGSEFDVWARNPNRKDY